LKGNYQWQNYNNKNGLKKLFMEELNNNHEYQQLLKKYHELKDEMATQWCLSPLFRSVPA